MALSVAGIDKVLGKVLANWNGGDRTMIPGTKHTIRAAIVAVDADLDVSHTSSSSRLLGAGYLEEHIKDIESCLTEERGK